MKIWSIFVAFLENPDFNFWKSIIVLSKYEIRLHIGPLHFFVNRAFEAEDAVYIY